ncbi:unnamed protein product, partial [Amoebophrya sp. A25]|eukprot:GSA25T00003594001.1
MDVEGLILLLKKASSKGKSERDPRNARRSFAIKWGKKYGLEKLLGTKWLGPEGETQFCFSVLEKVREKEHKFLTLRRKALSLYNVDVTGSVGGDAFAPSIDKYKLGDKDGPHQCYARVHRVALEKLAPLQLEEKLSRDAEKLREAAASQASGARASREVFKKDNLELLTADDIVSAAGYSGITQHTDLWRVTGLKLLIDAVERQTVTLQHKIIRIRFEGDLENAQIPKLEQEITEAEDQVRKELQEWAEYLQALVQLQVGHGDVTEASNKVVAYGSLQKEEFVAATIRRAKLEQEFSKHQCLQDLRGYHDKALEQEQTVRNLFDLLETRYPKQVAGDNAALLLRRSFDETANALHPFPPLAQASSH